MLGGISLPDISGRSSLQYHFSTSHFSVSDSVEGAALVNAPSDWVDTQPIISRIQSKITTSLAAVATAELPCTVKLRVWPHDVENPFAPLNAERCCLPYPMLSYVGYQTLILQGPGAGTSPTQHPVSAYQVMYELRTYSLEKLCLVLVSQAIRAAQGLTSIQFSPTSEYFYLPMVNVMVLFLKALSMMGKQYYIFNTILEFSTEFQIWNSWECFQVQKMRCGQCCLLSSICWRRSILWKKGKGKPRVLQCDGARGVNCTGSNYIPEENMAFVRW